MTHIIAIANQKGGVGKSTTTVNLCSGLALLQQRVLLIDLDPQGNATTGSGINKQTLTHSVYHTLLGLCPAEQVIVKNTFGFSVLPANRDLAGAEIELADIDNRERRLCIALNDITKQYDWIIIDCPPSLGFITLNGLVFAQHVIIPMQCEYYALEGLSDLVNTLKRIKQTYNPPLQIQGLLRTMFDPRNTLAQQVSAQLEQHFGDKMLETVIPRNIRLAEAPSHGLPIFQFDRTCRGSIAYQALTTELVKRFSAISPC